MCAYRNASQGDEKRLEAQRKPDCEYWFATTAWRRPTLALQS